MIRIIYTWRVAPENIDAFQDAWRQATTTIRDSVEGARGSFMLRETDDPGKVLTVARWDSLDAWKAFWKVEGPPEMGLMHRLGERISVQVCEEIADFTV